MGWHFVSAGYEVGINQHEISEFKYWCLSLKSQKNELVLSCRVALTSFHPRISPHLVQPTFEGQGGFFFLSKDS